MKIYHIPGLCILSFCFSILYFPVVTAESEGIGQQKSIVCQGCHGTDGNSLAPNWPHLAAQHATYLKKQIQNFRDGIRKNETMSAMAASLSDDDIRDIATYFSNQTIKPQQQAFNSEIIKTGRKIYKGGNAYSGVPACAGCHGPNGTGNGLAVFPRIAGQRQDYLVKTLNDFRSGERNNDVNEIMRNIASRLTDNEINAVAAYVATLNATIRAAENNKALSTQNQSGSNNSEK